MYAAHLLDSESEATDVSIQHLKDVHDNTHPGNLPLKDSGSDSAETTE
jgi:hypothetical protein